MLATSQNQDSPSSEGHKVAISLGLKNKSTRGTRSLDPDTLLGTRKTFTDTYYVQAASLSENEEDVLAATGIPLLRSLSQNAYLVAKTAREIDAAALLWEVDCYYDSNATTTTPTVEWSWSAETMDEVISQDVVDGRPIVNSVNEPLIVTWPIPIPVLTISQLVTNFSPQIIYSYMSTVNAFPFWGAPRGTALMAEISDVGVDRGGVRLRKVTYIIKFTMIFDWDIQQFRGWRARPMNHGTKYLSAGAPFHFKAADGALTTGNLNFDGSPRAATDPPLFLTFNHLRFTNFNLLRLGPFI